MNILILRVLKNFGHHAEWGPKPLHCKSCLPTQLFWKWYGIICIGCLIKNLAQKQELNESYYVHLIGKYRTWALEWVFRKQELGDFVLFCFVLLYFTLQYCIYNTILYFTVLVLPYIDMNPPLVYDGIIEIALSVTQIFHHFYPMLYYKFHPMKSGKRKNKRHPDWKRSKHF